MTKEKTEEPLRACPFCGGDGDVDFITEQYLKKWYAECTNEECRIQLPSRTNTWFTSEEQAIKAWNTRPDCETKSLSLEEGRKIIDKVLKSYQLSHTGVSGEEDTNFPLIDALCTPDANDIKTGLTEIEYIADDIIEALTPYLSTEKGEDNG